MDTNQSHVRQFLDDCITRNLDDSDVLPVADLYGMYIIWCEQAATTPLTIQALSSLLTVEGLEAGTVRRERVFKGVLATGPIPIRYILETDRSPSRHSPLGMVSS